MCIRDRLENDGILWFLILNLINSDSMQQEIATPVDLKVLICLLYTSICTDKTGTLTQNQMQVHDTNFYGLSAQTLGNDKESLLIEEGIACLLYTSRCV